MLSPLCANQSRTKFEPIKPALPVTKIIIYATKRRLGYYKVARLYPTAARCARYQSAVARKPCSREYGGDQPNSLRIFLSLSSKEPNSLSTWSDRPDNAATARNSPGGK